MAARLSLSKLRLSPRYAELARFHASDGPPDKIGLELDDAGDCEEVLQICRHLDLECTFPPVPTTGSSKRAEIRRSQDFPEDEPEPLPEAAPEPAPEALDSKGRPQKRNRAALEAETLLGAAPLGLAKFYRALVDSFPGHHVSLAKSLVTHLRVAGIGSGSGSSSESSESSSAKRRKKKRKKKKKDKRAKKRDAKKEEEAEDKGKGLAARPAASDDEDQPAAVGQDQLAATADRKQSDHKKALAELDAELRVELEGKHGQQAVDQPTADVAAVDQPTVVADQPAVNADD